MPYIFTAQFKTVLVFATLAGVTVLAGCSTQNTGKPNAALAPLTSDFGQPRSQASNAPVNMTKVRNYKLSLAPIIGTPQEVSTPLTSRLDTIAKTQSIPLAAAGESGADYTLKGYFSNMVEGNQTTVLYVWDVIDKKGNRVHRLQGQEKAAGKAGWASMTAPVVNKIADDTMTDYFRWASANGQ